MASAFFRLRPRHGQSRGRRAQAHTTLTAPVLLSALSLLAATARGVALCAYAHALVGGLRQRPSRTLVKAANDVVVVRREGVANGLRLKFCRTGTLPGRGLLLVSSDEGLKQDQRGTSSTGAGLLDAAPVVQYDAGLRRFIAAGKVGLELVHGSQFAAELLHAAAVCSSDDWV